VQNYLLTTLPSGARVISEPLETVRSVAIGLWIGTGSRDEDKRHAGATHFLEHLLFKGTQKYSAQEIAEIFDGFGGELNAATARDYTVVYARVLDEHLEEALDVMTDMVFAPALVDLDAEREVILEEIAMIEDTPQELIHDLLTEAVFGNHPLGRPVLGSAEVIANVSRRSIAAYHRARYAPGNVVVAAAGESGAQGAHPTRGGDGGEDPSFWPSPGPRAPPGSPRLRRGSPSSGKTPSSTTSASARRASRAPTSGAFRRPSSTGFSAARRPRGSFRRSGRSVGSPTPSTRSPPNTRTPARSASMSARGRKTSAPASRSSVSRSRRLRRATSPRTSSRRAKENLKGRIMLSMELTSNRMSRLGKSVITDSELLDLDRILAEIEAVDAAGVAELAGELLARERLSVAAVGPSEKRVLKAVEPFRPDLISAAAA
jgi:hypothetical protein